MKRIFQNYIILIVIVVVLLVCCIATIIIGIGGYALLKNSAINEPAPTQTSQFPSSGNKTGSNETLQELENAQVPVNDLRELASRLNGKTGIPEVVSTPPKKYILNAEEVFWVSNEDTNTYSQVQFTLRYISPHLYFWVESGLTFDNSVLTSVGDTFENKIYPTNRKFFGSEWTPGIDNDEHIYLLYARNLGKKVAGYFSSLDSTNPEAHPYSNAHEMIKLNADNSRLTDDFTLGVIAHEFQHMIHWYRDRNEESWLNEGFSELSAMLNGYPIGGFDAVYALDPDIQLNDWPNNKNSTAAHYGASFMFLAYFLDRFGEKVTQDAVANPENGLDSLDQVLASDGIKDAQTKKQLTIDDVFADWVLATYLKDKAVGDGRYSYNIYSRAPQTHDTLTLNNCPVNLQARDVSQYAVNYIGITCIGSYNLHFEGSTQVKLLPVNAHDGDYFLWSNKGDESDMRLTRSFDFTKVKGAITFSYWTWYDLEKDYDFVYLEASEDGKTWSILPTSSCTLENLSGNSYGCGYNGASTNWKREEIDLSRYSGKKVQLRFEYITDSAVNGEGFLLDDMSIPQVNYRADFEQDNGGWMEEGFARVKNVLPQTYRLSLITFGATTSIKSIELDSNATADIHVDIGSGIKKVVLVVSGTTRFTRQPAYYKISIQR